MGAFKLPIFLTVVFLVLSTVTAINITMLLDKEPNFSSFLNYLIQTKVRVEISTRSSVTVLAIPNDRIGDLSGKSPDVTRNIIRIHVLLDYFDMTKLKNMDKPSIIATLFQASGSANYQQGFVNISKNSNGEVEFASAVHGAPANVNLLGPVLAHPFNISILSVSGHIVTPGVEANAGAPVPSKSNAPPPAPSTKAPSPSVDEATAPSDDSNAEAPTVDAPVESPDSEAPESEPPAADDADAADSQANASSKNVGSISLGFFVMLASFLAIY